MRLYRIILGLTTIYCLPKTIIEQVLSKSLWCDFLIASKDQVNQKELESSLIIVYEPFLSLLLQNPEQNLSDLISAYQAPESYSILDSNIDKVIKRISEKYSISIQQSIKQSLRSRNQLLGALKDSGQGIAFQKSKTRHGNEIRVLEALEKPEVFYKLIRESLDGCHPNLSSTQTLKKPTLLPTLNFNDLNSPLPVITKTFQMPMEYQVVYETITVDYDPKKHGKWNGPLMNVCEPSTVISTVCPATAIKKESTADIKSFVENSTATASQTMQTTSSVSTSEDVPKRDTNNSTNSDAGSKTFTSDSITSSSLGQRKSTSESSNTRPTIYSSEKASQTHVPISSAVESKTIESKDTLTKSKSQAITQISVKTKSEIGHFDLS